MQKFNKDQIQKMVLSGILFCGLIYAYFNFMLGPLNARDKANTNQIADLEKRKMTASTQIRRGSNAQANAAGSVATRKVIDGMIPHEAPIAWLPPLVVDFFARQGIDNVSVKPGATEVVAGDGLTEFKYYRWTVEIPQAPFPKLAAALSNLENAQPLISVRSISVDTDSGDPEQQKITCEIKSLLK